MVRQGDSESETLGQPRRTEESLIEEVKRAMHEVPAEILAALSRIEPAAVLDLIGEMDAARRIFVAGAGRSKLMVDAFAMRLVHLGYSAYVVSDVTTPAIAGDGDLLLACSGSGETPTIVQHAETARQTGARLVVLTATRKSSLAKLADTLLDIPERSPAGDEGESVQFVGTLFEQCALVYLDAVVLLIERSKKSDRHEMLERHTNFE
ncbi:6-phospho-3-hexuloisomerase [Nocardia goodfellowii]|uniref:6-phospho-3-hexuloisomerase n=1 Tax=Nocardia goodfellowii TaxID=882446 RepID=A0ABS4QMW0_9NOCA|nr:6-phospho-3-hexuloisomerase [Nocardia goodfellowii]MBP2193041.1 6-phospho-3-hexuloisomerase [Nocardia goodfellowii]